LNSRKRSSAASHFCAVNLNAIDFKKGIMAMTGEEIFTVVRGIVLEVLPDLDPDSVKMQSSLAQLGANSIDRLDVTLGAMEALRLRIPMTAFAGVSNLEGLVNVLLLHQGALAS
jgi:polyketide biosynthesis acyl carrier protein